MCPFFFARDKIRKFIMRKTKIICTIGPASSSEQVLIGLAKAGMNVARLNFSHGTHAEQAEKIRLIKKVRDDLGLPIAIMLDTKGPEYRIGLFEKGKIYLNDGDRFTFTTEEVMGNQERVSVSYKGMAKDLAVGDRVLVNNGLLIFEVEALTDTDIICRVIAGGEMGNRKSMSFPKKVLKQTYLSEQDKEDLKFGIEQDVEFVACSFVSCAQDLKDVQEFLDEQGAQGIDLIAKIENQSGIDNIAEICQHCEGIMIGRGDMGVEIPFEQLPAVQKRIITECRLLGKRSITATEMLESMIHNPRPTRAEISDVANAIYDGTSAIMLSGETAAGKYPVLAVETMTKIAEHTEKSIHYAKRFRNTEFKIKNMVDAISHAACGMSIDIDAKAMCVCSLSGITVRMVSRFRCPADILGFTTDKKSWHKLSLSWGVKPVMMRSYDSTDVMFHEAKHLAQRHLNLKQGDRVVITGGANNGFSGNTNTIKAEIID